MVSADIQAPSAENEHFEREDELRDRGGGVFPVREERRVGTPAVAMVEGKRVSVVLLGKTRDEKL